MKLDHVVRWTLTPDSPNYMEPDCPQTDLCRDASGEVQYWDEETAIAEAMHRQDKTIRVSYTVEHRP